MIKFVDLHTQYLEVKSDIDQAIEKVIASSSYITGKIVEEFETVLAEYVGAEACASTGSGTNALMCALMACNIQPGDEIITTPHTFIATSEAIIWQGAVPVFVDIDENYQLNVDLIEQAITPQTRAILFVDMYGQTPDIDRLKFIADKYRLWLIEDAAHSLGSSYKGNPVGSVADLTCISFNPVKNLGAMGDAGAITGRKDLIDRARMYRDHGRSVKWDFPLKGINARIDNIQAAVVMAKLPHLKRWIDGKREVCHRYTDALKDLCVTPVESDYSYHSYYVYVIQVPERDKFLEYMETNGVQCNVHYLKALHTQPVFEKYYRECPVTDHVCNNIVSLPCYHNLSIENQNKIIELTKSWLMSH